MVSNKSKFALGYQSDGIWLCKTNQKKNPSGAYQGANIMVEIWI